MPHQHHAKHHHMREVKLEARQPDTVVSVVYLTASKTFDGPVGGYETLSPSPSVQSHPKERQSVDTPVTTPQQSPTFVQTLAQPDPTTTAVSVTSVVQQTTQTQTVQTQTAQTTSTPTQQAATQDSTTASLSTSLVKSSSNRPKSTSQSVIDSISSSSQASSATSALDTPTSTSSFIAQSATSAPTISPTAAATSQPAGMTSGAKAGLAIGIIAGIGALLALVFFCYRRKKQHVNEEYEKTNDEKASYGHGGGIIGIGRSASKQSARIVSTAPRLSLRPVTEFQPDVATQKARVIAMNNAGSRNSASSPADPFGSHAETSEKTLIEDRSNNPRNPFGSHAETAEPTSDRSLAALAEAPAPLRIRTPTPEGAAAGTAVLAAAGNNGRQNAPKPLRLGPNRADSPGAHGPVERGMPSPAGTEFSMTPVSPGAMANGPPPSNVHRIQLDFKPSMEDEIGLRAGQLVRLLHEYDDGWALCIRLDRSQQGVAPRTCLSARPVKPRPPPNARGPMPAQRGPPPPGMFGPPQQQRPLSPAGGRGSPSLYNRAPRPSSPGPIREQRSMSPGPYGGGPQRANIPVPGSKRRSNSASDVRERRNSPPGPSRLNPDADMTLQGTQRIPLQLQAVAGPDQAIPHSPSPSLQRKPVPGQAI